MATPEPDLEYLAPDFDPTSLTIPRLRSILIAHDVPYPASAKKSQLVDIFNEHVAPQAKKILNARSRTKRSTRGIKDVPSSQESTLDGDDSDRSSMPPPPVPGTGSRSSRRTTRARTEEDPDATAISELPVGKTPSKRSSTKHARASDIEQDERPAVRRTRKSMTPAMKQEDSEPETWHTQDVDSPFTQENPFQSGSSPADPRSISRDRRRKTLGPMENRERRKSRELRRKTDNYNSYQQDDGIVVPTSSTFEVPISQLKKQPKPEPDTVQAGEEFTPEEQLALVRERAQSGQVDILPPRRKRQPRQSSGVAKTAPWAVLLAMLGGFATVWRQEKLEVGYCGVGRPSTSLAGVEIPDWASLIQPQCEPCPQHAYCYPNLKTVCEPDFVLNPHPLSFGGLVPLPPTCEPDGEKVRRVKAVADRAVEELRDRNAKFECGEVNEEGKHLTAPEMEVEELKQKMSAKRRRGMSEEEWEDLWKGAIGEIEGRDEVVTKSDGTRRLLQSTSLARVPLSCAVRRSIRLALARHLWKLVTLVLALSSTGYARYSITSARETEARAKQLASYALDRLATHAALNAQDPRAYPETWISMAQLRDDILRDEFSASRRQKLWEKVQKKVEQNSNVRPMVREGRTGDVSRVWEWVGAVGAIEGAPGSSSRRDSGRHSLGPLIGSSPISGGRLSPVKGEDGASETKEVRQWDEGRPIY